MKSNVTDIFKILITNSIDIILEDINYDCIKNFDKYIVKAIKDGQIFLLNQKGNKILF